MLAAELASGSGGNSTPVAPKATKPKDLMRSVGKIEKDDWNVKEIEKKIMENRLGKPEPKTAEKVPNWDREQVSDVTTWASSARVSMFILIWTRTPFLPSDVKCILQSKGGH